jgi:hypothetical protein
MPRVDGNSDAARFCVTVWEEKSTYFTSLTEAEAEFIRLKNLRTFGQGELYEWLSEEDDWGEKDSFNHFR